MDEVRKQLDIMRQKAQASKFGQTLRTPVAVSPGVARTAAKFAGATPGRIVSQGIRQNAPLYKQAASGFTGSSTFGLAPSFAPAPQGLAQKAAYGVGFVGGLVNPLNPVTRVAAGLKTLKPVETAFRAAQRPLGNVAGKLISKGGATKLLGKGVANLSQGIPLTAAYALGKMGTGQKYEGKDLALDTGFDLAAGALIPGAGAAIPLLAGLSKKVVNTEIKNALKNEPGIRSLVGRIKSIDKLPITDQINLRPKLSKLLKDMLDEVAPTVSKTLSKIEKTNPDLWEKQAVAALEDRLMTAKDPVLSAGLQARTMKKLDTPKLEVGGVKQVTPELPQQAIQTTSKGTTIPESVISQQLSKGVDQVDNLKTSSESILSPVQKITQALQEAKPIRGQQEALYAKARSQQAARLAGVGSSVKGEKGYFAQLGQLKGQLPKAQFEGVRNKIQQSDIDELFNVVENKAIFSPFEKVNAKTALSKLLGSEGGQVPTKSELSLLGEVFPPEMIDAILSNRTNFQKLMSIGGNVINIPRAMMATADLSAPLRQGVFLVGRPKQWVPAFKDMFKYAFSEDAYKGLAEQIQSRPTYKAMRQNKLAITDMGPNMSSREEAFMSNLPEKIPIFGSIAKGSNRAYSGFLTKLRADVFDDLYKKAGEQGLLKDNPKVAEDIAKFVNAATGRGTLGAFEKATEILTQTAFAPRLVASRVQLLNPIYYAKLDPFVRKEALKSLLTFVGTGATVLGLAKMGGAEVNDNPTNSDFGKIKVGNTRYDIWGGFQQYVKLASQLASGKITSSTSGKVMTLGEGYKPMTRKDILLRFFEGKESPVASFITGLMTGQSGTGEPLNIPAETISRFIPLLVQDLYDLYNEYGPKGIAMGIPGAFGIGSQTYGKTELVSGQNKVGQPTQQIRPTQDLPTKLAEKAFGQRPLGSTSSWNAEVWLDQFKKMSKEEKTAAWKQLSTNPDLKKKVEGVAKARAKGITVQDEQLKLKGVASGDRAIAIAKTLNKAKTKEERNKLYSEYVRKGIITKEVAKQLPTLLKKYD